MPDQKRGFLGPVAGLIIGPLVSQITGAIIGQLTANPQVPITPAEAPIIAPHVRDAVEDAVEREVVPRIEHLTNTEAHVWQKRTFWSALVSVVFVVAAPIAAQAGFDLDENMKELVVTGFTTIGGLVSAYLAWRAGRATKPLGA